MKFSHVKQSAIGFTITACTLLITSVLAYNLPMTEFICNIYSGRQSKP